jgi:hypothetical protein
MILQATSKRPCRGRGWLKIRQNFWRVGEIFLANFAKFLANFSFGFSVSLDFCSGMRCNISLAPV